MIHWPSILLMIASQNVFGFYNPSSGRWLNRDPLGERGGGNLLTFASNDPIRRFDLFGLISPDLPGPPYCFRCKDKIFSPSIECCCHDTTILNKKEIDTGVVTFRWTSQTPTTPGYAYHVWLTWSGGSIDNNALNLGSVSSPAAALNISSYQTPTPDQTPLKLSPCKYNFDALIKCLNDKSAALKDQPDSRTCDKFANDLLSDCEKASEGCNAK
jgi:uncharacterized protein RhaS with RHS repeats